MEGAIRGKEPKLGVFLMCSRDSEPAQCYQNEAEKWRRRKTFEKRKLKC